MSRKKLSDTDHSKSSGPKQLKEAELPEAPQANGRELRDEQLDNVTGGTQSSGDWRCHIHPN
jgi:hypothetical protein